MGVAFIKLFISENNMNIRKYDIVNIYYSEKKVGGRQKRYQNFDNKKGWIFGIKHQSLLTAKLQLRASF